MRSNVAALGSVLESYRSNEHVDAAVSAAATSICNVISSFNVDSLGVKRVTGAQVWLIYQLIENNSIMCGDEIIVLENKDTREPFYLAILRTLDTGMTLADVSDVPAMLTVLNGLLVQVYTLNFDIFLLAIQDANESVLQMVLQHMVLCDWQRLEPSRRKLSLLLGARKSEVVRRELIASVFKLNVLQINWGDPQSGEYVDLIYSEMVRFSDARISKLRCTYFIITLLANPGDIVSDFALLMPYASGTLPVSAKVRSRFVIFMRRMNRFLDQIEFVMDFFGPDFLYRMVSGSETKDEALKFFRLNVSSCYIEKMLAVLPKAYKEWLFNSTDLYGQLIKRFILNAPMMRTFTLVELERGCFLNFDVLVSGINFDVTTVLALHAMGKDNAPPYMLDPYWHIIEALKTSDVRRLSCNVSNSIRGTYASIWLELCIDAITTEQDGAIDCFKLMLDKKLLDSFEKIAPDGLTLVNYLKSKLPIGQAEKAIACVYDAQKNTIADSGFVAQSIDEGDDGPLPLALYELKPSGEMRRAVVIEEVDQYAQLHGVGIRFTEEGTYRLRRAIDFIFSRFDLDAPIPDSALVEAKACFENLYDNCLLQVYFSSLGIGFYILFSLETIAKICDKVDEVSRVREWIVSYSNTLSDCAGGVDGAFEGLLMNSPIRQDNLYCQHGKARYEALIQAMQLYANHTSCVDDSLSITHSSNCNRIGMAAMLGLSGLPWHDDGYDHILKHNQIAQNHIVVMALYHLESSFVISEKWLSLIKDVFSDYVDFREYPVDVGACAHMQSLLDKYISAYGLTMYDVFDIQDDDSDSLKLKLKADAQLRENIDKHRDFDIKSINLFLYCSDDHPDKKHIVARVRLIVAKPKGFALFAFILNQKVIVGDCSINCNMLLESSGLGGYSFLQELARHPFLGPEIISGIVFRRPAHSSDCILLHERVSKGLIDIFPEAVRVDMEALVFRTNGAVRSSLAIVATHSRYAGAKELLCSYEIEAYAATHALVCKSLTEHYISFYSLLSFMAKCQCAIDFKVSFDAIYTIASGQSLSRLPYPHAGLVDLLNSGLHPISNKTLFCKDFRLCDDAFLKRALEIWIRSDCRYKPYFPINTDELISLSVPHLVAQSVIMASNQLNTGSESALESKTSAPVP